MPLTVLVVGASGNTGKHVVKKLLHQGHVVKVIVRSQERMMDALSPPTLTPSDNVDGTDDTTTKKELSSDDNTLPKERLIVTEKSLLDMTTDDLKSHVSDADAVVSCLGHNLSFQGIWRDSYTLVTDAVKRLTQAMILASSSSSSSVEGETKNNKSNQKPKKFILMGSDGVAHPDDDERSFSDRIILAIIRALIPPHSDNEMAAEYLINELNSTSHPTLEWVIVRPTDLIDDDGSTTDQYTLYKKPVGSLFGGGVATRSNVASYMVDLLTKDDLWTQWKYQTPVVHDAKVPAPVDETK